MPWVKCCQISTSLWKLVLLNYVDFAWQENKWAENQNDIEGKYNSKCRMEILGEGFITNFEAAYVCRLRRAPQYKTFEGGAISVSPFSSGLIIFMYVSWPKYHRSRFSALIFHVPTLSSEMRIAVQDPG